MKTGWVLSITDLEAKDKAFKCFVKTRKEVSEKADELLERYQNLFGEDRFKIEITSPHSEIDLAERMQVSCQLDVSLGEQFGKLHELNPFLMKSDGTTIFEIDLAEEVPEGFVRC